jgi:3-hydroxyisobutyrate dehydrogenase-like beta-hydroxyacid dehydrogenase
MRIAVLGTGLMGAPMARRLPAAGHAVAARNRTPAKASRRAESSTCTASAWSSWPGAPGSTERQEDTT